ncbi:hypothetical protein [Enorma sp.]|uniref:hypothetical protein n=1 Tax=Enorma sp. TaxID=1920692 RepID=UPI0025C0AF0D|nr:hypothetical protein [Enorma sp.]
MDDARKPEFTLVHNAMSNIRREPWHLVVIDLDDPAGGGPRITDAERKALDVVTRRLDIAIATSYEPDELLRHLERQGMTEAQLADFDVISLDASALPGAPARPTDELARICRKHGATFRSTAVIAACPNDTPLALEVGTVLALAGAGRACEDIAARVFPPRAAGGLTLALFALLGRE